MISNNSSNLTFEVPDIPLEYTTVWSFPERGNWATHNPKYRGNFAPQIARNIIEMYSEQGESILDPMVGAGTTLIEAKLLSRNALGMDINPKAIKLAEAALKFKHHPSSKQIDGHLPVHLRPLLRLVLVLLSTIRA